jgi:hypothetical protein
MNFEQAVVFPIIQGLEILFFNKRYSEQEQKTQSKLKDISSTIVIQKSLNSDFCIIYQLKNKLPKSLARHGCDIVLLVNIELLCAEDMQTFPDTWEFVKNMIEIFKLETHFCVIKLSEKMKYIFEELAEIPLPPTMFRFYMLLKAIEIFVLLGELNLYSSQVHFYPYKGVLE